MRVNLKGCGPFQWRGPRATSILKEDQAQIVENDLIVTKSSKGHIIPAITYRHFWWPEKPVILDFNHNS